MTPRPVYRWKSFWLGVQVLAFLGWAWWVSYRYMSHARCREMVVEQWVGYVSLSRLGGSKTFSYNHIPFPPDVFSFEAMPPPFMARGKGATTQSPYEGKITFKEQIVRGYSILPKDRWGVHVPHWLLVGVFTVTWVSFLGWRMRRQRRLTTSITP